MLKERFVYTTNKGQHNFKLGNYVGQLTNEWIVEFCSMSPKCYLFKTNKNREIMHVKGFGLKGDARDKFSFKKIKCCVDNKKNITQCSTDRTHNGRS